MNAHALESMMVIRRKKKPVLAPDISPISRLWIYRILVQLGGHKELIGSVDFNNTSLAEAVGLAKFAGPEIMVIDPKEVRRELHRLYLAEERRAASLQAPISLHNNVDRLADLIGLSRAERRIMEFAILLHIESVLEQAAECLGNVSTLKVFVILSQILDLPEADVRAALSARSVLSKSALVTLDRGGENRLRHKLDLLTPNFADYVFSTDVDPVSVLRDTVALSSPPHLDYVDFGHLAPSLSLLRSYLKRSVDTRRKGVNIFLHGAPGTGKNQLAKILARELQCELFEVASEDGDGDPVSGERRLSAFRAAQHFLTQRRALILFDEVEDVFNIDEQEFGFRMRGRTSKAWINRILEDNITPTIWLSNSISQLDPAYIRRFDMVMELPVPPKKQRERIIHEVCGDLMDSQTAARLAASESLAPAIVARATSVVRLIRDDIVDATAASAIERLIGNTLEGQGHRSIQEDAANRLPPVYDPAFIHADANLAEVAAGLIRVRAGRLCLYGPPGTGKTAYGRWLAEQLGVPLLVRRASDLMSKWVGGSEKKIADAFREAQRDGALLLIDEVDSFLQDRRSARQSWEVSLVNEMLTQMESFAGVFIASTNLMSGLDQAALRRFDLKVKFDFMRPDQSWELASRYCMELALPPLTNEDRSRLGRLLTLTPGDFAAVVRQNRFRAFRCSSDLVAALCAECDVKEGPRVAIGFR